MKWLVIALIVIVVIVLGALIWSASKRRQEQHARLHADELRSEAADQATDHAAQEARAREAKAEADRVRAQADQLDTRAAEEKRTLDMSQAQHEETLREADRIDPEVDHTAPDYTPGEAHPTGTTSEETARHISDEPMVEPAADGTPDVAPDPDGEHGRHQA